MQRAAGLAYREVGDPEGPAVLLVHGYPSSSYMWEGLMDVLGEEGWRCLAPDLAGFGASDAQLPGTWESHSESLERFRSELGLDRVVVVGHDWGVAIASLWAVDHRESVVAVVISSGGLLIERWHDFANALRTPGTGEELMRNVTRELVETSLRDASSSLSDKDLDEAWKCYDGDDRRQATLDLYRSGDPEKLQAVGARLTALNPPALLLWGANDSFSKPAMGERLHEAMPGSELSVLQGAGHFIWQDDPEEAARVAADFLGRLPE